LPRAALLLAALLLLGGCGFRPLYGEQATGGSTAGALQTVQVAPIADRPGQQLHNALRNELNPLGQPLDPLYSLAVSLTLREQELGVRKDDTATRANLRVTGDYSLIRIADDVVMTRGRAQSVVAYNIVGSEFGTYQAEEDARQRGIEQLAQQIRLRLAAYLERLSSGVASP